MSEKKTVKLKSNLLSSLLGIVKIMFFVIISTIVALSVDDAKTWEQQQVGIELVKALYDFKDAYQLDSNMVTVKELTTEPIFNDLTIDNEQRTLTTYLKFNNEPCTVNVLSSSDTYVMYSLKNNNIDEERLFVFFFRVNNDGKVDWYKEVEGIEFVNTIY